MIDHMLSICTMVNRFESKYGRSMSSLELLEHARLAWNVNQETAIKHLKAAEQIGLIVNQYKAVSLTKKGLTFMGLEVES